MADKRRIDVPAGAIRMGGLLPDVARRGFVYPKPVDGRFQKIRRWAGWILIAVLFALPWVRVGGLPSVLIDIPARRFVLFGTVFWPQDIWLLFFLVAGFVLGVVLVTAQAGRVWCGYACPQSVFSNLVFLPIERFIEGDRNAQMRLDKEPWTRRKWGKKILKHALFSAAATAVAHAFLAFFIDPHRLAFALLHPTMEYSGYMLFAGLATAAMYADFAFFREQFCNFLCPYARFQSALLDEQSLIVAYDPGRGEPRRRISRDQPAIGSGDCIDCDSCVLVCPQGIDIRDGLQLECIHCAACIDACDHVMDRVGRPRGLIRYASERELRHGASGVEIWRPRTLAYLALLGVLASAFGWQLTHRRMIEATLVRPAGEVHRLAADGSFINHFRLQLANKDRRPRLLRLEVSSADPMRLTAARNPVELAPDSVVSLELFIGVEAAYADGRPHPFHLVLRDAEDGRTLRALAGSMLVPAKAATP